MLESDYIVLGGGMTGDAAVRGLREIDSGGGLALISDESDPPYNRPPLSKGLWKGADESKLWRGTGDLDVDLFLNTRIVGLDPAAHQLTDERDQIYRYGKLLLATGGSPRKLPFGDGEIIYFRTVQDYRRLRELADSHDRFVIVGGGFIGSELAAALAEDGNQVTIVFPEPAIGALRFPESLGTYLNEYYSSKGVKVLHGRSVVAIEDSESGTRVSTDAGDQITADAVVVGIGIIPSTSLAESAGLKVGNGIVVDGALRTSDPDIYAAGDVASFHNPAMDFRMRVEHENNANTMGTMAGKSMAGADIEYDHLPFFYSDLFDLGYEAIGELDGRMETIEDWKELGRKGVVYYLDGGRVRGVLLWNTWGKLDAARDLLAEPGPVDADRLTGLIGD